MSIIPQLKQSIKNLFKHDWMLVAGFVILPLIMSIVYGIMMEDTFTGKATIDSCKVQITYNENSDHGKILKNVLSEKSVQSFIETSTKDPECKIKINDEFNKVNIENISASEDKIDILKNFFLNFLNDINTVHSINKKLNNSTLNQYEQNKVRQDVFSMLGSLNKKDLLKEEIMEGHKTLSCSEYFGISTFSFTSIFLIMILTFIFYRNEEDGVIRRTLCSPVSKTVYILGFAVSSSVTAFIINMLYIIISRSSDMSFKGNIFLIIFTAASQSIMQGSIATALVTYIRNKKVCMGVVMPFLLISAVAGGAFNNIDDIESSSLSILSNTTPSTLILKAFRSVEINGDFSKTALFAGGMLLISLIFIAASEIKAKVGREY